MCENRFLGLKNSGCSKLGFRFDTMKMLLHWNSSFVPEIAPILNIGHQLEIKKNLQSSSERLKTLTKAIYFYLLSKNRKCAIVSACEELPEPFRQSKNCLAEA